MKLSLLALFTVSTLSLSAQTARKVIINGTVIDSASNQPLGFARVSLSDDSPKTVENSTLTKDNGMFELTAKSDEKVYISISYVGYQKKSVVIVPGGLKFEMGKISLSALSGHLKEITVTGTKTVLKQEIDRISYNVQADPDSKANDALEMLKKIPMVTVDGSDKIQLKGSDSYRIFINGRPSALMANDPSEVLKSMPAATILKIEVITIPPSKYDGEGLTGIINIITVARKDDGFNGSVFARYNNNIGERGSISLAAVKGKFSLNGFFGLGHQKKTTLPTGSQLTNFQPATNLTQQGTIFNTGNLNNGQAQFSYEADSLNLFTSSFDFARRDFIQNNTYSSQLFGSPDSLQQAYRLSDNGDILDKSLDFGISYQRGFRHHKQEMLTMAYQYISADHSQANFISAQDRFNFNSPDYSQRNSTGSKENTFQIDFVRPLSSLTVEAGAKAILRYNNSDFEENTRDGESGIYIPDASLTNQFTYHQNVYSLYNTYQLKLSTWVFKGGLRAENTEISGRLLSDQTILKQHYFNLIPAVSIQRNAANVGAFTVGFTERFQRPVINELNPFIDKSNPDFITVGNPNLRPVISQVFELDYSRFTRLTLNASLSYTFANNVIQTITSLLSDTLSQMTYLNTGKSRNAGINLSMNYPVTSRLQLTINGQISHVWLTGRYNNLYYATDGTQGNAFGSAAYKLNDNMRLSAGFFYNGAYVYLQGKSNTYISSTYVITKDFWNKRATLSFTVYDPYHKYNIGSSYTRTPDFYQSSWRAYYYRSFRIGFNYKFGKLNNTVKNRSTSIKNDDVKRVTIDSQ